MAIVWCLRLVPLSPRRSKSHPLTLEAIWDDDGGFVNWLDSGNAGPCNETEGDPKIIQQTTPDTDVRFSNIKWGDIGSTT